MLFTQSVHTWKKSEGGVNVLGLFALKNLSKYKQFSRPLIMYAHTPNLSQKICDASLQDKTQI